MATARRLKAATATLLRQKFEYTSLVMASLELLNNYGERGWEIISLEKNPGGTVAMADLHHDKATFSAFMKRVKS